MTGGLTGPVRSVTIAAVARLASVLILASLFGVLAPAQALAQEAQPLARLPELRVIAPPFETGPLPRSWVPGRVEILTDAEIQSGRPSVLPDALERLPGVTLQNEQGNPFQPNLTLRGFSVSSVSRLPQGLSVFLDGVRINEPTVEEVNFDLIPLEDAERVEVIRGPSVLFGRNTLGGAINIITRRGEEIREIVPEFAGGSFGRQHYRLRASGEARPLDYYVSLHQVMEDGYRDFTSARLSRAFVKIGVHAGDTDATVSYQFSNNRIEQAGSLPQTVLHEDRRANLTAGDFWSPELNFGIVNVRRSLGEHWTLSANAFVRSLDAQQFNVNLIAENTRFHTQTLSVGGALELTHRGKIAERDNVLIVGAEYTRSDAHSRRFEGATGAQRLTANLTDTEDAVGVFGQDSLMLARDLFLKGSTLVVTVAVRWDGLRHDIDDLLGGPSGGVFSFNRFVPRAGVNLNLTDRLGFYASYAEGFRAPAFLELTCAGPGAVCPGLQVGVAPDPPIQPVKTTTYEVGTRARLLPWLDADASGYWTNVEDDIFSVSPSGTTGVFFQNIGRTRRQGVEVGLRGRLGTILEGYLNYAYTRATFQDRAELATPLPPGIETVRPGNSLALVPRHRINLGAAYHPWPWATLSLDVRYVGTQFLRGDEVNRQPALPGYWVAGLGASVKVKRLEAFVRLNNALNNRYETFGTFAVNGLAPGQPVERFLTPAQPLNFLAGLQYAF